MSAKAAGKQRETKRSRVTDFALEGNDVKEKEDGEEGEEEEAEEEED